MSVNSIPFNPMATTNAAGSFSITSDGYVQGVAMDDPAIRNTLASGLLSSAETVAMIGGAMISENIAGGATILNGTDTLGGLISRATSIAGATGISVLNQAHHGITSAQSQAPVYITGMTVHFHRFGSGARIAVAIDPSLGTSLQNGSILSPVSWDFSAQRLVPYSPVAANQNITGITWANGVATVTFGAPHGFVVGNDIVIAGAVPAGFNGDFPVATVPTTTTLTYALPNNPGTETTPGIVVAGGGTFPGRILKLAVGNSKVITIDPASGAFNWSNTGACALVLI